MQQPVPPYACIPCMQCIHGHVLIGPRECLTEFVSEEGNRCGAVQLSNAWTRTQALDVEFSTLPRCPNCRSRAATRARGEMWPRWRSHMAATAAHLSVTVRNWNSLRWSRSCACLTHCA